MSVFTLVGSEKALLGQQIYLAGFQIEG